MSLFSHILLVSGLLSSVNSSTLFFSVLRTIEYIVAHQAWMSNEFIHALWQITYKSLPAIQIII